MHNDPVNATDPTGMYTCANDDCTMANIDNEVGADPIPPIDDSLAGGPEDTRTKTITFKNDVPGLPSTNVAIDTETAAMVEEALMDSSAQSININSTTGGNRRMPSRHAMSKAVDINRVDGGRVDDPNNADAVSDLQDSFAGHSNIRENYGPSINEKTVNGITTDRSNNARIVALHRNHIHASGQ